MGREARPSDREARATLEVKRETSTAERRRAWDRRRRIAVRGSISGLADRGARIRARLCPAAGRISAQGVAIGGPWCADRGWYAISR